jgi:hypothetical protein
MVPWAHDLGQTNVLNTYVRLMRRAEAPLGVGGSAKGGRHSVHA